jgi:predicted O-methyltransferase YrrM
VIDFPYITAQKSVEFTALVEIYKALEPMHVLEIGSQEGGTLYHWVKNAPAGATIVNVDILQNQTEKHGKEILARWQSWKVHTILGSSHSPETLVMVKQFSPFDFVFIDGDHTYDGTQQDWEWYSPLVRKGGVVAFHDLICPGPPQQHIQVGRLFNEIKAQGYKTKELYSELNQKMMGIGVVYV